MKFLDRAKIYVKAGDGGYIVENIKKSPITE